MGDQGTADFQFNVSQTDATGAGATGGALASGAGCLTPYALTHITTGVDPAAGPDATITVDFGYNYQSGLAAPAFDQVDLFTVLLHEATHALGFVTTLSGSSCAPMCCAPVAGAGQRLAAFSGLFEQGGTPLISCPTGTYNGGSLVGGSGGVRLDGCLSTYVWQNMGNVGSPPLYTPATFACGSSVNHWDSPDTNPAIPANVVMQPSVGFGDMRRTYHDLDLAALADIGYDITAGALPDCPGSDSVDLVGTRWGIVGQDIGDWTGKLVFESQVDGNVSGRVDWIDASGVDRGRELFTGTLDDFLVLELTSFATECNTGIGQCFYFANVQPDGSSMSGTWGVTCTPGTWSAVADPCPDVTGDGVVSFSDLTQMLSNWGTCEVSGGCPATCPTDINADGTTGFTDLVILLNNWGCSA
jgi:hypothetical protein